MDGTDTGVTRTTPRPQFSPSTSRSPVISTTQRIPTSPPRTQRTTTPRTQRPRTRAPAPTQSAITVPPRNANPNRRVLCHQCGSLFSGSNNPDCTNFDASSEEFQGYCKPGESCLYYTWEKSVSETSIIRECITPSILLGPITNPLRASRTCDVRDISEFKSSSIMACICDTDKCNVGGTSVTANSPGGFPGSRDSTPEEPKSSQKTTLVLTDEETSILGGLGNLNANTRDPPTRSPATRRPNTRQTTTTRRPATRAPATRPPPPPTRDSRPPQSPSGGGGQLQCFSCGSLFNPDKKCDKFDPSDPSLIQTCGPGEACLLYSWEKSTGERATARECFSTSILLGPINNQLLPLNGCQVRDISEPGASGVEACLCTTNLCNSRDGAVGAAVGPIQSAPIRNPPTQPPANINPVAVPQTVTTRRPSQNQIQGSQCPPKFKQLPTGCYFFAQERMGWIEAKKECEFMTPGTNLVAIETPGERDALMSEISSFGRSRYEFWTAGNDIDREDEWVWSGSRGRKVPEFGWIDLPITSAEENCLTWSLTNCLEEVGFRTGLVESELLDVFSQAHYEMEITSSPPMLRLTLKRNPQTQAERAFLDLPTVILAFELPLKFDSPIYTQKFITGEPMKTPVVDLAMSFRATCTALVLVEGPRGSPPIWGLSTTTAAYATSPNTIPFARRDKYLPRGRCEVIINIRPENGILRLTFSGERLRLEVELKLTSQRKSLDVVMTAQHFGDQTKVEANAQFQKQDTPQE
eukprot:maker-scaffold249_size238305-snap-gene-1.13 protein:Tk01321 transcript:maker-scaffold249_size238305-snap-gene-1.13-mRNA-1 annotation:"PREDICTED: collectin-12-like"